MQDSAGQAISPKALLRYVRERLRATLDPEIIIGPKLSLG